jgi:hypothetical protein
VSLASFPPELRLFKEMDDDTSFSDQTFRLYSGGQTFALILLAAPVAATAMRIPVAS